MKAGSIASNPNKLRIMKILAKKSLNLHEITKATRLPDVSAKGLIEELVNEGFVEESNGVYKATEEGIKALKALKV